MMTELRFLPAALVLSLAACGGAATMDDATQAAPAPATDNVYPTQPPDPMPVEDLEFPAYVERTLSNGARLVVVENPEQPVVSIQLVVPAGSAEDPAGQAGLASLTAAQIDKGTTTRSAQEIAEAMDFIGAQMGASASSEWTSLFVTSITDFQDEALGVMSDVVLNPTFPEEELETEKRRRLSALRLQKSQPASLAQEAFMEGVYGEHPYGQTESVESIEAISVADLEAFHAQRYTPGEALFVVAGDVDPDQIARDLEVAFAGWEARPGSEAARAEPPTRTRREMVFVHKPGSVQAVIRLGHLFPSATAGEWPTLDVSNQILGAGAAGFSSWMMSILREERGYTYGAYSAMSERQGPGYFAMSGEFRNEVADSSLMIMLELAERLRDGDIPQDDLDDAKLFLTGSFPLGIESPQQVASQVASNRLLGRPDSYLTEYRTRVAAVDADDVARATREHIHPDRMLIVVVGDALQVLDDVRPFADEVRVMDADGEPVDLSALAAAADAAADISFDASGLEPQELHYGIIFQGNEIGTAVTRWTRDGGAFVIVTEQTMPGMTVSQSTQFDAETFAPTSTVTSAGAMGEYALEIEDGRAVGTGLDPQRGPQEVDVAVGPGTALADQFDIALALTDFADVGELTLPVLTGAGAVEAMTVSVAGEETVEVPAGTFETYRLEQGGTQPMTVWVTKAAPHIVVKRELAGQPVSIVLKSM